MNNLQSTLTLFTILLIFIGLISTIMLLNSKILPYNYKKHIYVFDTLTTEGSELNFLLKPSEISTPDTIKSITKDSNTNSKQLVKDEGIKIPKQKLAFNMNPKLLLWVLFISLMVATAAGLIIPCLIAVWRIMRNYKIKRFLFFFNVLLTFLLAVMVYFVSWKSNNIVTAADIINKFNILLTDFNHVNALIVFTFIPGAIAVFGMLTVNVAIEKLNIEDEKEKVIALFVQLSETLKFFLSAFSILIVYAIVTTSLIQQSIESVFIVDIKGFYIFPTEFIYAYGLIFTIFLAIIYIPIYHHLKLKGIWLQEKLIIQSDPNLPLEKIEKLKLQEGPLKNLQVLFSILAPILGSVFSEALKSIS